MLVNNMPEAFECLMFSFIILILLVMRDMQMELKEIHRELKRMNNKYDDIITKLHQ